MTLANVLAHLRQRLFRSGVYDLTLRPNQTPPLLSPPVLFPGDGEKGRTSALGDLVVITQSLRESHEKPKRVSSQFDRFRWLADLEASGLETAASVAREFTGLWMKDQSRWSPDGWHLDVLSERLSAWLSYDAFLRDGAEPQFNALLLPSLHRQARHLSLAVRLGEDIEGGFGVSKALVYCALLLPASGAKVEVSLTHLEARIEAEILPDGGHRSRNPSMQLSALRNLIDVRGLLSFAGAGVPVWLQIAIDRMAPLLRAFRHGDGGLCLFNGAVPAREAEITRVLEVAEAKGRAVANAPHSGFQRLSAGKTLIIMDAGIAETDEGSTSGHAGTLSFEMSSSKRRVIVNCGVPRAGGGSLIEICRGSAAHSALVVENTNSTEILDGGQMGPRRAQCQGTKRTEVDKNLLVESGHDGYLRPFGLLHKRALFLSADGADIRGEDILSGPGRNQGVLRFHLHPDVQASRIEGGRSLLLRVGKTQGWRFRTSGYRIELEDSIYFGDGERRQTAQIVVPVDHQEPETVIKWSFQREK